MIRTSDPNELEEVLSFLLRDSKANIRKRLAKLTAAQTSRIYSSSHVRAALAVRDGIGKSNPIRLPPLPSAATETPKKKKEKVIKI